MKPIYKAVILVLFFSYLNVIEAKEVSLYQVKVNEITFSIDPRIELFNIIAMQAGHPGMTLSNISYKLECLTHFAKYKNLEAPKLLKATMQKGWGIDDPMFFLLYLDYNFNLKEGLDSEIIKRGGGIEQITKLAKSFKNFAKKSHFSTFFNKIQKGFYNQILLNVKYNFKNFKGVEYLENYFGEKANSYNLILNINSGYGNFGKKILTKKGIDLYAIVETNTHSGNIPTYYPTISIIDLILHEFSHGFVNPSIDKYKEKLSKNKQLYEPIAQSMQHQAYWHWQVTVNEHIVRAIVTRITEQYFGNLLSNNTFYKLMIARRFIYVDAIIEKLKIYENNRSDYKNFNEFVPELIKVFDTISEDYIVEKQNKVENIRNTSIEKIPKPYEFANDSTTYFIVSTRESNKKKEKQMQLFVSKYRDMISKEINIVNDTEALKMNFSENDIVIFGTTEGNLFLKKYIDNIPIKITKNCIISNKIVKGTNLQLVTSWISPFNDKKSMIIYTAQKIDNIKDFFFSVSKDQYHYWIAENLIPIDVGNYEKYSRVWMPKIY
ncbi:MAG TPA: DUF4932 domain-containing protein [Flavobacteriia bacterium]|jgi:hypothetical protein|nr:DUF4932 domain-containing protein [Flavobacteriia bacterium]